MWPTFLLLLSRSRGARLASQTRSWVQKRTRLARERAPSRLEIVAHCLDSCALCGSWIGRGKLEYVRTHLDYLEIAFLSSRLRVRTVAVGWSAGFAHGLWHEPAGRWIGAPCSRFLSCWCVGLPRSAALVGKPASKVGEGEVEGMEGEVEGMEGGCTGGWGQHPRTHEPCWASCGLWTLKPRLEGGLTFPAASFLTLPALGAVGVWRGSGSGCVCWRCGQGRLAGCTHVPPTSHFPGYLGRQAGTWGR